MKTEKNILTAFLLNLFFSIFEFIGGMLTGSVAILSDSVHDIGDAASIGIAYFLERKSKQAPDEIYTYGYTRYSVMGGVITSLVLLLGSVMVIYNAVVRMIQPAEIHYDGMILFAVIGVFVNAGAAFFTREGGSLNQKAVNLHMLEDVLGWIVVLTGAIVMRFTDFSMIDPIMSIGVAVFILINAWHTLKDAAGLFLEKTPNGIDIQEIEHHILEIEGVSDLHHLHIWSMDAQNHCATMHIVTNADHCQVKQKIRQELLEHGIGHVTLELESEDEVCSQPRCAPKTEAPGHHHHHHHHH